MAFWVFEIGIGIVLPVFICFCGQRRKITGILVASVMVLVGYFVKRYDFVVASQVYPLIKAIPTFFTHTSIMEVYLIGGILEPLFLAYTLGVKFLPLKARGACQVPHQNDRSCRLPCERRAELWRRNATS